MIDIKNIFIVFALWSTVACSSSTTSGKVPTKPDDELTVEEVPAPTPERSTPIAVEKESDLPKIAIRVTLVDPSPQTFERIIKPILDSSCAAGGCHSTPLAIDLRSFPFDATGSYIKKKIDREIGADPSEQKVQAAITKEIIESMRSGFMPPVMSELDPVEAEKIALVEEWLINEVGIGRIVPKGEVKFSGMVNGEEICSDETNFEGSSFTIFFDRSPCVGADALFVTLTVEQPKYQMIRKISGSEFWSNPFWELSFGAPH